MHVPSPVPGKAVTLFESRACTGASDSLATPPAAIAFLRYWLIIISPDA